LRVCFRINLSGGMQNVLGRIAATLVILCPVIVFSIPESAIQASSIKSSQTEQVKEYYFESIHILISYLLNKNKITTFCARENIINNNSLTKIIQFKMYIFTETTFKFTYIINITRVV